MSCSRWLALGAWTVLAAGTATAQAPDPGVAGAAAPRNAPGVIVTHAEARRRLPNTVSDVSVSIEVHAPNVRIAAAQLGQQSQALLGYLRGQATERLRTEQTSFEPELQEQRGRPDRIKGVTARTSVSFRTTPDALPDLLAGCLDHGATGLAQSGSTPREAELDAARRELIAEASRAALGEAQAAAAALGQRVTGVQRADVDMAGVVQDPAVLEQAARPAPRMRTAPVASEAGASEVMVQVVLTMRVDAGG